MDLCYFMVNASNVPVTWPFQSPVTTVCVWLEKNIKKQVL